MRGGPGWREILPGICSWQRRAANMEYPDIGNISPAYWQNWGGVIKLKLCRRYTSCHSHSSRCCRLKARMIIQQVTGSPWVFRNIYWLLVGQFAKTERRPNKPLERPLPVTNLDCSDLPPHYFSSSSISCTTFSSSPPIIKNIRFRFSTYPGPEPE